MSEIITVITASVGLLVFVVDNVFEYLKYSNRFKGTQKADQILRIKYDIESHKVISRIKLTFYIYLLAFWGFTGYLLIKDHTIMGTIYGLVAILLLILCFIEQYREFRHRKEKIILKDEDGEIWLIKMHLNDDQYVKVKMNDFDQVEVCSRKEIIEQFYGYKKIELETKKSYSLLKEK